MARVDVRSIRRAQILDATGRLVAEHGWERATFAEICKAAGVSNRVLTYHFRDKDDILLALLERTVLEVQSALLQTLPPELPLDRVIPLVVAYLMQTLEQRAYLFRLFLYFLSQAPYRPDVAERLQTLVTLLRGRIAELVRQGVERGEAAVADVDRAAAVLQAAIAGLVVTRVALGLSVPEQEVASMLLSYLLLPAPDGEARPAGRASAGQPLGEEARDAHA